MDSSQKQQSTTAQRVRAIARELNAKQKAKWERIENAVCRLDALADDIDAGVEGDTNP